MLGDSFSWGKGVQAFIIFQVEMGGGDGTGNLNPIYDRPPVTVLQPYEAFGLCFFFVGPPFIPCSGFNTKAITVRLDYW
jgi:hypothetical protein